MRRADRLFQVIQLLRRQPVLRASDIARDLEVSERTVYRDIRDLVLSGVPIEGEAGVGYTLRRGYDLPPLMFTAEEIEALVLGARVVGSWGDAGLARAARDAIARVEMVLPPQLKDRFERTPLHAPGFHVPPAVVEQLGELRAAVDARRRVKLSYRDKEGAETVRTVRPLGLFFWGATWTLTGWCELRDDFRVFRLERMDSFDVLDETFDPEPGRMLDDFIRTFEEDQEHGPS